MRARCVLLHPYRSLLWIALSLSSLQGQGGNQVAVPRELLKDLPAGLDHHATALGNRVRGPGRERTVLTGTLVGERDERVGLRVILQLPSLVRIEGLRANGSPLIFDGESRVYPASRLEEHLLEIFSSDTTEGMLASVKEGAAAQLLGRRVGSAMDKNRADGSRRFDVYEVAGPIGWSPTGLERLKRYFFDSETGLLVRTQYVDEGFSPPVDVETQFSDWRNQEESTYPGRIERLENGRTVFSFTVTSIVALPRQEPANLDASAKAGQQEE